MNERIRAREIRVIGADGEQLGIMTPQDATRKAREQSLDLVEISATAVPPVCRIMDYGKFLYEQEKKERAAKKNQKQIVLKEVKFSVNVDEHDYVTKRNHVLRFLGEGDKVKASLRLAHHAVSNNPQLHFGEPTLSTSFCFPFPFPAVHHLRRRMESDTRR